MYKLEVTKKNDSTFKLFAFPTQDKVMISPVTRLLQQGGNIQDVEKQVEFSKKLNEQILDLLSKATGKDKEVIRKDMEREKCQK